MTVKPWLKKVISKRFWKSVAGMTIYFAIALLVLHDVFIIIAHSISPEFLNNANPYLLGKLFETILNTSTF